KPTRGWPPLTVASVVSHQRIGPSRCTKRGAPSTSRGWLATGEGRNPTPGLSTPPAGASRTSYRRGAPFWRRHRSANGTAMQEGHRFEDRGEIGRGGMSSVRRVFDRDIGRDVAVKSVAPASDAAALDELLAEARIVGGLQH